VDGASQALEALSVQGPVEMQGQGGGATEAGQRTQPAQQAPGV